MNPIHREELHLDSDEYVVLEVRRYWIAFAEMALGFLCGALLPFAALAIFKVMIPSVVATIFVDTVPAIFLFVSALWLLFLWLSFFTGWTMYALDAWYITNKRIIDMHHAGLLNREAIVVSYDKVQDVTVETNGLLQAFFGYGTVRIRTAGEGSRELMLDFVHNPGAVRAAVSGSHVSVPTPPSA